LIAAVEVEFKEIVLGGAPIADWVIVMVTAFFLGEAEALVRPAAELMLELPLLPRAMLWAFSFFLSSLLCTAGTGDGVGGGKADELRPPRGMRLLLILDVGRDEPTGAMRPPFADPGRGACGRAMPQLAVRGKALDESESSADEGLGHADFCVNGGGWICCCFCLASYSAGRVNAVIRSDRVKESPSPPHSWRFWHPWLSHLTPRRNASQYRVVPYDA
jgi:hypothetical protein